jgi:hypothetical protein
MSDREQPRDLTPPTAGQWKVVGLELAHRCTFCGRPSSATVGCPDDGAPVLWQAGQDAEGPLARIDEALALAQQTEQRWTDAFLHRIRGDILLKAHPANPARAEDAYHAALAVAREQGARSFGLCARHALPIDRPPNRSPRRPRACARRLHAHS